VWLQSPTLLPHLNDCKKNMLCPPQRDFLVSSSLLFYLRFAVTLSGGLQIPLGSATFSVRSRCCKIYGHCNCTQHLVSTIRTVGLWKSTKRSESAFSVLDELNLSHGGYFPDVIEPFSTIFHAHLYANTLRSRIQKVKPFEAFGLCFRYIAARTLHLGLSI
jgi:hypothetical protein